MARRRQRESSLDALLTAPWWVSAALACGGFVFFHWLIPAATVGNPLVRTLSVMIQRFGILVSALFGLLALVLLIQQRPWRQKDVRLQPPHRGPTLVSSHEPYSAKPDAVLQTWESLMSKPKAQPETSPPKPTQWSLDLLQTIEWKRFEELCAAFYREIGLRSETIRCGADGGIDAKLYEGDAPDPVAIIQCKAWRTRMVGVKPVRELLGVMAHHKVARGVFLATGEFTKEAIEFANANPIDLIDGAGFMALLAKLNDDARLRLLAVATDGDYLTPTCPSCGVKMLWRDVEKGFWGCRNYPRCKVKFFTKAVTSLPA